MSSGGSAVAASAAPSTVASIVSANGRAVGSEIGAFLEVLDFVVPVGFEAIVLIIEAMQLLAISFVEAIPWVGPLRCVLYVTHLPIWEPAGTCLPFDQTVLMVANLTAVGLVMLTTFFALIEFIFIKQKTRNNFSLVLPFCVRILVYLISRPLFIPLMRLLLQAGWVRGKWGEGLIGFIATIPLVFWSMLSRGLLFDVLPASNSLYAASTGRVHVMNWLFVTLTLVLLASASPVVPQVIWALGSLASACAFWYCQPHLGTGMNSFQLGLLTLCAVTAVMAVVILILQSPSMHELLSWIWIGVAIPVILLGFWMNRRRFSPRYDVPSDGFPNMFQYPYRDMPEPEEVDEETIDAPHAGSIKAMVRLPVLRGASGLIITSHIPIVRITLDVELAVRFMYNRRDLTPDFMQNLIHYCDNVYKRALERYPDSTFVKAHYGIFMASMIPQEQTQAYAYLKAVLLAGNAPLDTWYMSYKLISNMAASTSRLHDLQTTGLMKEARRHHRAALVQMVSLWHVLMSDKVNVERLNSVTSSINKSSLAALDIFRALGQVQQRNPIVLRQMARFIQTVMNDQETAQVVLNEAELLEENAEPKSRSAAGSQHSKGNSSRVSSRDSSMGVGAIKWLQKNPDKGTSGAGSGQPVNRLSSNIQLAFLLLLLLLGTSCGLYYYFSRALQNHIHEIAEASIVRTATAEASAVALASLVPGLDTCGIDVVEFLYNVSHEILHGQREITTGDLSVSGSMLDFFRVPKVPLITTTDTSPRHEFTEIVSMWDVGFITATNIYAFADSLSGGHHGNSSGGGGAPHGAKFKVQAGASGSEKLDLGLKFLMDNGPTTIAHSWNVSVNTLVADGDSLVQQHGVLQVVVAVGAVTVVLGVFIVYSWSFRRINIEKSIALHLFTKIPYATLENLAEEAEMLLENFDRPDEVAATKKKKDVTSLDLNLNENDNNDEGEQGSPLQKQGMDVALMNEDDGYAQAGNSNDNLISNKSIIILIGILVLQFLLSLMAVACIYYIMVSQHEIPKVLKSREESLFLAQSILDNSDYLTSEARGFTQFVEKVHYDRYWKLLHSGELEYPLDRLVELGATKEEQLHIAWAVAEEHAVEKSIEVALRLAIAAHGLDITEYREIAGFTWDVAEDLHPFDWTDHYDNGLHYTTSEHDLALPPDLQGLIARSILFDEKYHTDEGRVRTEVHEFERLLEERKDREVEAALSQVHFFIALSFVVYGLLLACFLIVLLLVKRLRLISKKLTLILLSAIVVVAIELALLGSTTVLNEEQQSRASWKLQSWKLTVEASQADHLLQAASREFVQFGNMRAYHRYWDELRSGHADQILEKQYAMGLTDDEHHLLEDSHKAMKEVILTEEIAMVLAAWALDMDPAQLGEVYGLHWDHAAEPTYEQELLQFPQRKYWYTSRANDMKMPKSQQAAVARYILFDQLYEHKMEMVLGPLYEFEHMLEARADKMMESAQQYLDLVAYFLIAATALFMISSVGLVMYLMSKILDLRAGSMTEESILSNTHNQTTYRVAILAALLGMLAVIGYGVVHIMISSRYPSEVALATDRDWLLMRCLYHVEFLQYHRGGRFVSNDVRKLKADLEAITELRQDLYFGGESKGGHVHTIGSNTPESHETFREHGVNQLMMEWMTIFKSFTDLLHMPGEQETSWMVHHMWCSMKELFHLLRESEDHYKIAAMEWLQTGCLIEVLVTVVIALFIIFEYITFVNPIINHAVELEEATKSLMRLIPQHVINEVPSIKMYVQTGVLSADSSQEHQKNLEESNDLLGTILPPSICDRLKAGESPIADYCKGVTIMFTHIVGFSRLQALMTPKELVGMLNRLFCAYDELVEAKGLEKIKTVGDSYMMAGNLLKRMRNSPRRVVECALEMLQILDTQNEERPKEVQLEQTCGIHTGNVVAGVLGYTTVAFDIWGAAVNQASRMESTGKPGALQVSQVIWDHLKGLYEGEEVQVQAKGIGTTTAYRIWPPWKGAQLSNTSTMQEPLVPEQVELLDATD